MEEEKKDIEEREIQKEIELKSPAVQEILGRPPRWIIRWGITVILIVIGGSCFLFNVKKNLECTFHKDLIFKFTKLLLL